MPITTDDPRVKAINAALELLQQTSTTLDVDNDVTLTGEAAELLDDALAHTRKARITLRKLREKLQAQVDA